MTHPIPAKTISIDSLCYRTANEPVREKLRKLTPELFDEMAEIYERTLDNLTPIVDGAFTDWAMKAHNWHETLLHLARFVFMSEKAVVENQHWREAAIIASLPSRNPMELLKPADVSTPERFKHQQVQRALDLLEDNRRLRSEASCHQHEADWTRCFFDTLVKRGRLSKCEQHDSNCMPEMEKQIEDKLDLLEAVLSHLETTDIVHRPAFDNFLCRRCFQTGFVAEAIAHSEECIFSKIGARVSTTRKAD